MEKYYWLNCTAKCGERGKEILERAVEELKKIDVDAWIEENQED